MRLNEAFDLKMYKIFTPFNEKGKKELRFHYTETLLTLNVDRRGFSPEGDAVEDDEQNDAPGFE